MGAISSSVNVAEPRLFGKHRRTIVRGKEVFWIKVALVGLVGGGGSAQFLSKDHIQWQIDHANILTRQEGEIVFIVIGDDELSLTDLAILVEALEP